ncbi:MAG: pyridoxal phosphate-dependent aminotransferase [Porticoccaceae bacterium]|nr:pyridoxal phosphate-dependent aminotransferase [Porticoccaceae bacterium]
MAITASNLRSYTESQTLLINQQSNRRAMNGEQVFRFGFGQSPFPVPNEICSALANSAARKEYMSVQGDYKLRDAITCFHRRKENKRWDANQIIIGPGSKILIYCLMAAFHRAEVVIPAPSWVSYAPQAKLAGHKVSWLQTTVDNKWRITPQELYDFLIIRDDQQIPLLFIFNYPSNPTGQSYTRTELKELAKVFKQFNVIVIADEIYSLLSYETDYATLEEFYPSGTITSSGMSKWCGAGGWRLGFVHVPEALGKAYFNSVIGIASETYSCAASPIQVAATAAYELHELADTFLTSQILALSHISSYCSKTLRQAGIVVHEAQGGFYLFPDFSLFTEELKQRDIISSQQLTSTLLSETGVALLPGSAFGMPNSSLTARLAFVDFDGAQIFNNQVHIIEFNKIKAGINRLITWLEQR